MNFRNNAKDNHLNMEYFNYVDIIKDSYIHYKLDNSFIIFKSIDNILFLIYSTKNISIISFNLIDNKKINEIKNAHKKYIANFRHYLDEQNKRDLIISISAIDNNIKLWNMNNLEILYNFEDINKEGEIYSACFLNDNNKNYIITSNSNLFNTENMKVFDFEGNKIKEIKDSNFNTFSIELYYDKITSKKYIISGNYCYIQSFDYVNNKFYKKYNENELKYMNLKYYAHFILYETNIIKLICSCGDSYIREWDFHSGKLLRKIKFEGEKIYGICIWDDAHLFSGFSNGKIQLIKMNDGKIIQTLKCHYREVLNIKKISHPLLGDCLISQGFGNDFIKLWVKS